MENKMCITAVSAIIERVRNGQKEILLQTRWRVGGPSPEPEYHGTWELPQGRVEPFENVFDCLRREIFEETGLKITNVQPDIVTKTFSPKNDGAFAFEPFCCIQQLKSGGSAKPWIGFVFVCHIEEGEPISGKNNEGLREVGEFKWFSISELENLIKESPEKFFTYNLGALDYYLSHQ